MYKVLLLEDDLTLQDMIVEYFIDNNYKYKIGKSFDFCQFL